MANTLRTTVKGRSNSSWKDGKSLYNVFRDIEIMNIRKEQFKQVQIIEKNIYMYEYAVAIPPEESCGCHEACEVDKCGNAIEGWECNDSICSVPTNCSNRQSEDIPADPVYIKTESEKGVGAYASYNYSKGQVIIEYVGEIYMGEGAFNDGNEYVLWMSFDNELIDSRFKGNYARYINHSCDPNSEFKQRWIDGFQRTFIHSIRDIGKNMEITVDYMSEEPHVKCLCKSKNCRGFF
jgi:hypothetical protein